METEVGEGHFTFPHNYFLTLIYSSTFSLLLSNRLKNADIRVYEAAMASLPRALGNGAGGMRGYSHTRTVARDL
jgi:hypothetical protein